MADDSVHPVPCRLRVSSRGWRKACTVSSAVAAHLALGRPLAEAVRESLDYVHRAIATAPGLGSGHGPLNHSA